MGLTLPGVLGRVFAAAGNLFQSSQVAGDAFPRQIIFGDGGYYVADGTVDLTALKASLYGTPTNYIQMKNNSIGQVISGINDGNLKTLSEWHDYAQNPIMSIGQVGGLWLNDNFRQAFGIFGPFNVFSDIYGHFVLTGVVLRASMGPPGNILTFADACGEVFQRDRGARQGSWTATNATYSAFNFGPGLAPTTFNDCRRWTALAAGSIVTQTGTATAGPYPAYPIKPGQFVAAVAKTRSVTVARSKTLSLVWWNAAGTSAGSDTAGAAVTDTTTGFTQLGVQGVAPSSAVRMGIKVTVAGVAGTGEQHDDTCAGLWPSMTLSQITAWNFPYVYHTDVFLPAPVTATAVTGNTVSPIVITVPSGHPFAVGDTVTTSGFTPNTAANQSLVAITAVTATSVTIPGTGNGATSGGQVGMNYAGDGRYDGAFAGDVFVRADGPPNIVQRFQTNAVAGPPWLQDWNGDPRITSQPARANWWGGNYLQQGLASDLDYVLPNVALGMLHNDPLDSVNHGVLAATGTWNLLSDAANAQTFGGAAALTQGVRKKNTGAPYVSKDGMFTFFYGLWDLANIPTGGGSGQMTQYNATGNGAVVSTMRDLICHARASSILGWSDASFAKTGGSSSGTVQYCYTNGGVGAGGQGWIMNTVGNNFVFTVPADFTGGAISFSFLGAVGAFGGQITWTGTLFSTGGITNPGVMTTSNTPTYSGLTAVGSGSRGRVCVRFKNLTAAHAGLTVTGTVSALDAGGNVFFDCAYVEGIYPNLTAVCGMPKLVNAGAYVTLGGAGSYWNSNAGATGAADVAQLNTALLALVNEFADPTCFYVDMDSAVQSQASFFGADGCTMGALGVHAMASQFVAGVQSALPLIDFRNVNHDYRDTSVVPVGGPFTKQGPLAVTTGVSRFYADDYYYLSSVRASVGTAPAGAPVIVDVLKNGSTIFTTAGNRPSITAATNTATSAAAPDLLFVQPGDYLTVNVVQTGTGPAGSDLTVSVLGRKIPIP